MSKLGVTLQVSSVVMVGNFEVPVTPSLRECFSRSHDETSGSLPTDQQFGKDEQHKMYQLCWVLDDNDMIVVAETEANVLELMHYLSDYGLTGQGVIADIRLFSENTVPVAKRLHCDAYRRAKEAEALAIAEAKRVGASAEALQQVQDESRQLEALFLAPAFKNTTAA